MFRSYRIVMAALVLACAVVSCSEKQEKTDLAARAAELYFGYLLSGDVTSFVEGMDGYAQLPDAYKAELRGNAAMFAERQHKEHGGLRTVSAQRNEADSTVAEVFMSFEYGDGTKEQVLVPMVRRRGLWYMR